MERAAILEAAWESRAVEQLATTQKDKRSADTAQSSDHRRHKNDEEGLGNIDDDDVDDDAAALQSVVADTKPRKFFNRS